MTVAEVPRFIDFAPAHRLWAVRGLEKFNKSQIEILKVVSHQKLNSIELIQGPPGTGKTTTIVGMINMLISGDPSVRIHVCAPSNAAVDQILPRVPDHPDVKMLRIGATRYAPPREIEKHNLRDKMQREANLEEVRKL